SAMDRASAASMRQDAAAEKREERERQAREAAAIERFERTALVARQLGIEPGAMSAASVKLGDQQAVVGGLREELERAEKKLAAYTRNVEYINRMMSQAAEAAGGRDGYPGEMPASRHARQVAAEVRQAARSSWYED